MITVISGTNREGNVSVRIAKMVVELLTRNQQDAQLLDLQKLPLDFVFRNDVFGNPDPGFSAISNQFIETADKFVFVIPEYNGSFPGVCKAFIDAIWPERFKEKKAAIIGLSSGRAGNVRGADHLTNILNYLEVTVHPIKVNITHVEQHLNDAGELDDERIIMTIGRQMEGLLAM